MSQTSRIIIWAMVLIGGLEAGATPARAADKDAWTVIFRADDPLLWKHPGGAPSSDNGFAAKLDGVPEKMRYLRLKRMDTGDAVIVAVTKTQLQSSGSVDGDLCWNGNARVRGKSVQNLVLGISRMSWATAQPDDQMVYRKPGAIKSGYRGWGFSTAASGDQIQTYSWAGQPIDKTIFEIAVKDRDLTADEKSELLNSKSDSPAAVAEKPTALPSDAAKDGLATTKPSRRQTSIHTLHVQIESTGQLLGGCSELILTETPGKASGDSIPVSFTTAAGHEMHMVLDDVLRAVNVKYPHVEVSKIELSFADKYTPKDGGSIGAACGTLILSMIEGYEIDDKLAITGDVTADSKIRRIGGVAAKIRGATAAGCKTVALPSENYDQVVDAMVYEGLSLLENCNVIGVDNLDGAAAVARVDRAQKLADAIKLFGEVQEDLKKSPERIHLKANHDKLATAADLWPADYSIKLLLLASQDKQPKRLSALATEYYANVAIKEVTPILSDRSKRIDKSEIRSSAVQGALQKLDKVRRIGDPKILPYVDASRNFIRELDDIERGIGSLAGLEASRQKLLDTAEKLDSDRDLAEKMNNEGI